MNPPAGILDGCGSHNGASWSDTDVGGRRESVAMGCNQSDEGPMDQGKVLSKENDDNT